MPWLERLNLFAPRAMAFLTRFGTPVEIVSLFGGKDRYLAAIQDLESQLYPKVA